MGKPFTRLVTYSELFILRYLKKHVWTEVFQKLLNIKDIDHMPNLGTLKELIDAEAFNMESELVKHIRTLSNLLKRR